jgi:hypothetical protein
VPWPHGFVGFHGKYINVYPYTARVAGHQRTSFSHNLRSLQARNLIGDKTLVCEESWLDLQLRQGGSSPFPAVRTVSGSTEHPVESVPRALTAGLKRPGSGTTVRSVGEVNVACSMFLLATYLHVVTPNDLSDKEYTNFYSRLATYVCV